MLIFDRRWIRNIKSLSYSDKVICNFAEMEGSYVEETWFVFELHSINTFCERNVCEEGGVRNKIEP